MMNDNEKKLSALREENPFTSSSVGDPWEDKYPDVRSINERAFNEISQLIARPHLVRFTSPSPLRITHTPPLGTVFGPSQVASATSCPHSASVI